jgi:UDP-N-acetylglucosamine acyltransferase
MSSSSQRPGADIHPTAIVDGDAEVAAGVSIGPYTVVGPGVSLAEGVRLGPHVLVDRDTTIGAGCVIHKGAVLGTDPQDLKYAGEPTRLTIGARTVIREYATLNRGTTALGYTTIGDDCLLMAYAHVAHDCQIGNRVILSNSVNMGGHVVIQDWAVIGGGTQIHQFARIGCHAFIGGASAVRKDIPPFVKASGSPMQLYGLNSVGLQRRGFSEEVRRELKRAYRLFFGSSYNTTQALARAREELRALPEIETFLSFFEASERGVSV